MTVEEARKIAGIIDTAHDGCFYCVSDLAAQLTRAFPAFKWETLLDTTTVTEVQDG